MEDNVSNFCIRFCSPRSVARCCTTAGFKYNICHGFEVMAGLTEFLWERILNFQLDTVEIWEI